MTISFIDYLGAEDSEYTRAVCRKMFVAAIARAMTPGCKFDIMLILCGPQGIGKSTLLDHMSHGWFNDSIRTFEGKEASELLQGVWLVEVAELDAFRRTDVARIKQFLSLRADRYRAAYGRNVKELPRCCVFFGTCNQMDFLQDTTGNRRFWPVDVGERPYTKTVWRDLTDEVVDPMQSVSMRRAAISSGCILAERKTRLCTRWTASPCTSGTAKRLLSAPRRRSQQIAPRFRPHRRVSRSSFEQTWTFSQR